MTLSYGTSTSSHELAHYTYRTKIKTVPLNCVSSIYEMKQASKANEGGSECSKTSYA